MLNTTAIVIEENKEFIGVIFSACAGAFAIIASIFNWDFFFESRKARFMTSIIGRDGSRIFYAAVGIFLFYLAYKMSTQ